MRTRSNMCCFVATAAFICTCMLIVATDAQLMLPPYRPHNSPHQLFQLQPNATLPANITTSFQWHVPRRNLDWLHETHAAISDPQSPRYRQFVTKELIDAQTNPEVAKVQLVMDWLLQGGIQRESIEQRGSVLHVTRVPLPLVERLFNVTLRPHQHERLGKQLDLTRCIFRALEPVMIPQHLIASFDALSGINDISPRAYHSAHKAITNAALAVDSNVNSPSHNFHPLSSNSKINCPTGSGNLIVTTASFVASQYGISPSLATQPAGWNGVRLAVVGGINENDDPNGQSTRELYDATDLNNYAFDMNYAQATAQIVPQSWATSNNVANSDPAQEATLDIQAAFAFCPTCQIGLIAQAANAQSLFDVYTSIYELSSSARPHIVSLSYSYGADSQAPLRSQTDTVFQQLGAVGVTLFASSGDDGAQSSDNRGCQSPPPNGLGNNGNGVSGPMIATWPAAAPYLTSVGATDFYAGISPNNAVEDHYFATTDNSPGYLCGVCKNNPSFTVYCQSTTAGAEEAVGITQSTATSSTPFTSGFTSGGGVSSVYTRPSWQTTAVNSYFATTGISFPPAADYSRSNHFYPHIAAFGGIFPTSFASNLSTVVGTSLSAPALAGMFGSIVSASLTNSGQGLGFVSPTIFQLFYNSSSLPSSSKPFNDIISGDNVCPQIQDPPTNGVDSSNCVQRCTGWATAAGYDPVTGVGSPNIANLQSQYLALLSQSSSSSSSASAAVLSSSLSSSASTSSGSHPSSSSSSAVISSSSSSTATGSSTVAGSSSSSTASAHSLSSSSSSSSTASHASDAHTLSAALYIYVLATIAASVSLLLL